MANPDVPDNNAQERDASRRAVFGALPGRLDEIAAETGLALATVRRHIKQLRAANKVRISTFDSPQVTGKRWTAVWAKGWGSDAILTREMLTDYVNAKQRRNDKRLNQRRAQHGWIASLGRLPAHRESDMQ